MSKHVNKALIGAFVLGAVALVILAVAVIGSGRLFSTPVRFVMFFDSSLKGLNAGSPVTFRGVPIGRVSDIRMDGDLDSMQFFIPVFVDMDTAKEGKDNPLTELHDNAVILQRMLDRGLRGRLNTQSLLTGQLLVELDFYPSEAASQPRKVETYEDYLIIPTIPSQFDTIWQRLADLPIDKIADNLLSISDQLAGLLRTPGLNDMPANLNAALVDAQRTMSSITTAFNSVNAAAVRLTDLADRLEKGGPQELARVRGLIDNYSRLAVHVQSSVDNLGNVLGPNSITILELNRTLREISDTAKTVRDLADMLEQHPESLIRGKGVDR